VGIVHPTQFDFYLNSHAAIQGTNNCILYHVLYNEIGFSSDELQQLTYYLCHTDVRCTKSVKMPACARYAHNICYDARYLKTKFSNNNKQEEHANSDGWDDGDVTLADIESNLIMMDPTIKDTMWFA